MRSLEDILANPPKRKKHGFGHISTSVLLQIPPNERTPEVEALLVERHQRLAYSIAVSLWGKYRAHLGGVVGFEDILVAAMQGLLIGVRRFNALYANEFSTYAIHWIRQSAYREIENNIGMARIPLHFQNRLHKLYNTEQVKTDKLARLVDFRFGQSTSLDAPLGEDMQLIDMVPSTCSLNQPPFEGYELPESPLLLEDLRMRIEESISELMSGNRREMVRMRYGFGGYDRPHTLEEVGEAFSVTRERVRQITAKYEEKVLKKRLFDTDELAVFRRVS